MEKKSCSEPGKQNFQKPPTWCIRHFQSNCKQKLHEIGIWEAKAQKVFLDKGFGIPGKEEGIVDSESRKEVKEQFPVGKKVLDEKEKEILQKQLTYQPLFSKYLDERRKMIAKTMTLNARRKAGMPNGLNGKPLRPYTNGSEAMNNVLLQTKESYLHDQKKPEMEQFSKLEFMKNIFEEVHCKQQEELALAVIGLSDQYELTNIAAHLASHTSWGLVWMAPGIAKWVNCQVQVDVSQWCSSKENDLCDWHHCQDQQGVPRVIRTIVQHLGVQERLQRGDSPCS